jgi:hypothetical protein
VLASNDIGVTDGNVGGGIVFDSVEEDEYVETINKLGANVKCIEQAEGELTRRGLMCRADWSVQSIMLDNRMRQLLHDASNHVIHLSRCKLVQSVYHRKSVMGAAS